jgi:hypothetical protein
MDPQVFQFAPSAAKTGWLNFVLIAAVVVTVGVAVFTVYTVTAARNGSAVVNGSHLVIKAGVYGRKIPLSELNVEQAEVVNLYDWPMYAPKRRRNGIALAGFQGGWFRLANQEKALVFVSDPGRTVYIPTHNGYSLLFSLNRPEVFLRALRAGADREAG